MQQEWFKLLCCILLQCQLGYPAQGCIYATADLTALNPLPLVPHICVSELSKLCFRQWLVAFSASSHYLNQSWFIVNWTLRNKFQWNLNQNTKLFIHKDAFENVVYEMAAILSRGRCVKASHCMPYYVRHSCLMVGLTHLTLDKMAASLTDDNFKCIFLHENDRITIWVSLKLVPKGPIDNKSHWFR